MGGRVAAFYRRAAASDDDDRSAQQPLSGPDEMHVCIIACFGARLGVERLGGCVKRAPERVGRGTASALSLCLVLNMRPDRCTEYFILFYFYFILFSIDK
jgi:hypothetical protein